MRHRPRSFLVVLSISALVAGLLAGAAPAGAQDPSRFGPPSPVLIERALERGEIDLAAAADLMLAALTDPDSLPAAFASDTPFHGTIWLLKLEEWQSALPQGPEKAAQAEVLLPPDPGSFCSVLSTTVLPDQIESEHFYIEYDSTLIGGASGLTIDDYIDSLEHSWAMEIDSFGWVEPPVYTPSPPPGDKYHVRIDTAMAPVLYGFVSNGGKYAGPVDDNPHSAWDDVDADASCMGLNNDYSLFPGTPRKALDATTAHEFNHSIQFGIGALFGTNAPDDVFVEGGATWMEDEAYDSSNDNYNYLWPTFEDDMGEYEDSPYPYWITFRGLTERYGASIPGGGEDVMQAFWEITSQQEGTNIGNLVALNMALAAEGGNLKDGYHAYAVAVKFNRACGGGYVYPYCFEEGPQYVNGDGVQTGAGETDPHGSITTVPGTFNGAIPDNYSLNWVTLPGEPFKLTLTNNASAGGQFRLTIACDTGSSLMLSAAQGLAGPLETVTVDRFDPATCTGDPVAVVTNQSQTAANPTTSVDRAFTLATDVPPDPTCPGYEDVPGNHIVGTEGPDRLIGTSGVDIICGLGGIDIIHGLDGDDILIGGEGNDSIFGGQGNDVLLGGPGGDALAPGLGDDEVDGGDGTNTVSYFDAAAGVAVDLQTNTATGGGGSDSLANIRNIIGSSHGDTLAGDGAKNVIRGRGGNDTLLGRGGVDQLDGGLGDDTLDGGAGRDIGDYALAPSGVTVDLAISGPQDTVGYGVDTLIDIEDLRGSEEGDVLSGNAGANILVGFDGDDQLFGRDGKDRLFGRAGDDHHDGGDGRDLCSDTEGTNTFESCEL